MNSTCKESLAKQLIIFLVISTSIVIYIPSFKNLRGEAPVYHDHSKTTAILISYVAILAGSAAVALDVILDSFQLVFNINRDHVNRQKMLRRVFFLFLVGWPSFHAVVDFSVEEAMLIIDSIFQKYLALFFTLIVFHQIDSITWNLMTTFLVFGPYSVGVILSTAKQYSSSSATVIALVTIQYALEGFALVYFIGKAVLCCKQFPQHKVTVAILTAFIISQSILLALLQLSYNMKQQHNSVNADNILLVSNYVMLAWSTLPVIMPSRTDRETAVNAEKLNQFRRSFTSYISHEIRTPLNVSSVGVAIVEEILQTKQVLDEELQEILGQTKNALAISTEILNDLLTFEKLNSNAMTLEPALVNPLEFVLATANIFEFQAREKKVNLILPRKEEIGSLGDRYILIDSYKMSQVLRNLISNALKFTPPHGNIKVSIKSEFVLPDKANLRNATGNKGRIAPNHPSLEEWVNISVTDDGVGIAAENISKLFKEIVQFDANKLQQGKGTGLGLFISRGIVELHGGRISAFSEGLGMGCMCTVRLPVIRNSSDDPNHPSQSTPFALNSGKSVQATDRSGTCQTLSETQSRVSVRRSLCLLEEIPEGNVAIENSSTNNKTLVQELELFTSKLISGNNASQPSGRSHEYNSESSSTSPRSRLLSTSRQQQPTPRSTTQNLLSDLEAGHLLLPLSTDIPPRQLSTLDLRDCRVLIVDDSVINLKMMMVMIKRFGAECVEALNGKVALDYVLMSLDATGPPIDMVIMDNNMDIMNGPSACKLMRAAGFHGPIFGLTGDTDDETNAMYRRAGADHVFQKPMKIQEIVDKLTQCSL